MHNAKVSKQKFLEVLCTDTLWKKKYGAKLITSQIFDVTSSKFWWLTITSLHVGNLGKFIRKSDFQMVSVRTATILNLYLNYPFSSYGSFKNRLFRSTVIASKKVAMCLSET